MTRIIPPTKQILTGHRGAVLILVGILMFVLLGFAAFAIDLGYSYVIKNQLQNVADAAALAGASVLFTNNQNCTSSGSPYSCCSGPSTGVCDPNAIVDNDVTMTAQAVVAINNSGGNSVSATTIEIGHYAFASSWGSPGVFTPITPPSATYQQMPGWETHTFSDLNGMDGTSGNPFFINAVRATVSRTDVPRFFSRIWGSSDLAVTAQATAYIGFAGTLLPGQADQPIAICEQSIKDSNGAYTCNVGTMLNQNTQTARWTNYDQANCGTASDNDVRPLICAGGNPNPIIFGQGVSSTNGTLANAETDIYNCWKDTAKFDSDGDTVPDQLLDTDGDGKPDHPWTMTLPVIDCSATGNCLKVVGAVEVNVVWINESNAGRPDGPKPWVPSSMYNPNTGVTWSCSGPTPQVCWDSFRDAFNLKNNNLTGPALWADKTLYFFPDCKVHAPQGGTGGDNYGILARYPVLVKCVGG